MIRFTYFNLLTPIFWNQRAIDVDALIRALSFIQAKNQWVCWWSVCILGFQVTRFYDVDSQTIRWWKLPQLEDMVDSFLHRDQEKHCYHPQFSLTRDSNGNIIIVSWTLYLTSYTRTIFLGTHLGLSFRSFSFVLKFLYGGPNIFCLRSAFIDRC